MGQELKKDKRFSIIVAAYNIQNYIQKAIESVEGQTFEDYELIIVNDCSTDKTDEKINELTAKYDNIVYLKHEINKKLGAARNTALKEAKGEYIVFLDGDDYFAEKNVLEKLDELIGDDKTDVIYLGFKMQGSKNETILPTEETCNKTYKAAIDKYPNVWSKCWRKEFLSENNIWFPENRFYEDVLFNYNGIMKANAFKMAEFITHIYISGRTDSITTRPTMKNIDDTVQNIKDLLEMRENEYIPEIDIVLKREFGKCKRRLDEVMDGIM